MSIMYCAILDHNYTIVPRWQAESGFQQLLTAPALWGVLENEVVVGELVVYGVRECCIRCVLTKPRFQMLMGFPCLIKHLDSCKESCSRNDAVRDGATVWAGMILEGACRGNIQYDNHHRIHHPARCPNRNEFTLFPECSPRMPRYKCCAMTQKERPGISSRDKAGTWPMRIQREPPPLRPKNRRHFHHHVAKHVPSQKSSSNGQSTLSCPSRSHNAHHFVPSIIPLAFPATSP